MSNSSLSSNRLWWSEQDWESVTRDFHAGDPVLHAIIEQAGKNLQTGKDPLSNRAFLSRILLKEPAEVVVQDYLSETAGEPCSSALGRARLCLLGVELHEVLHPLLSTEHLDTLRHRIHLLADSMRDPGPGNPHTVTNNWWAVTHSAALLGFLCVQGLSGFHTEEDIAWCTGRLTGFLQHFGSAGLYHEGLGYQVYTCCYLLNAVYTADRLGKTRWLEQFPNLRNLLPSLYVATSDRPAVHDNPDATERHGAMLLWNDASGAWSTYPVDYLGLHLAPEAMKPGLKAWFQQVKGLRSPAPDWGAEYGSLCLAWTRFPRRLKEDLSVLPLSVCDARQGLYLHRNRYQNGDDIVFGLYAKNSHAGGHVQEDAGSLRLSAFGADWIEGPGQARPDAWGQSVVTRASGTAQGRGLGACLFQESRPDGFVFGMDLRKVSGGYHERYVTARWDEGAGAALVFSILDQIDDHLGEDWLWHQTYTRDLAYRPDPDRKGFTLTSASGWVYHLRFSGSVPVELEICELPPSHRVFAGGNREDYLGKPVVRARFASSPRIGIQALVAIQRGTPAVLEAGNTTAFCVNGTTWDRPFGAAIPDAYRPGASAGLCAHPHGRP